jgi:hypothetical protein
VNLDCSSNQAEALKEVLCCPIAWQRSSVNAFALKLFGLIDRVLHQGKTDTDSSRCRMNPQIVDSSDQLSVSESFVREHAIADETFVGEADSDSHVVGLEIAAKSVFDRLATTA